MRVSRSLMLFLAVALTAGGCAQRPVMRVMAAGPAYGGVAQPAAAAGGRGYLGSSGPAYAIAAAPALAPAPAYRPPPPAPPPAPVYAAPAPTYAAPAPPTYAMAAPAAPTYAAPAAPAYPMAAAPPYGYGGMAVGGRVAAAPVSYTYGAYAPGAYAPSFAPPPQYPYTLDSGDRLRVVVFGQDGLTNSYLVDASGQIQMPLIGSVSARGLTADQLSERIAEMLRQGFVREPHVAVEVEAYRPFFILGEVAQPGQYPYTPNMTVETAVAIAGGFGPRALHGPVTVSHNVGGQMLRFDAPLVYQVQPGDTIRVKERWF
jgi:Polysaccharide biosynthesis/export protein/SLBB domain